MKELFELQAGIYPRWASCENRTGQKGSAAMTGGGSLLYGLNHLIANVTGVKTRVADKAVSCVAIGTGRSLEVMPDIPEGAINISRQRSQQRAIY